MATDNRDDLFSEGEDQNIAFSTAELDDIVGSADITTEETESQPDDLEEYGVWVKVKPEDVVESPLPASGQDLELTDLEEGGDEPSLTDEEEDLLDHLDSESTTEFDDSTEFSFDETPEAIDLPDAEGLPSIDETSDIAIDETSELDPAGDSPFDTDDLGTNIGLPEVALPEEPPENADGEISEAEIDSAISTAADDQDFHDGIATDELPDLDDSVDIDVVDLDLETPVDQEDLEAAESEDTDLELDLPDVESEEVPFDLGDEPDPLEITETAAEAAGDPQADDDFEIEVPLSSDEPEDTGYQDIHEIGTQVTGEPLATSGAEMQVLARIEDELRSIVSDLGNVKRELAEMRQAGGSTSQPVPEPPTEPDGDSTGFFEEDDDETIALTGDELDNILNTAEQVTEEVAEPGSPDDDPGLDTGNLIDRDDAVPSDVLETSDSPEAPTEDELEDGPEMAAMDQNEELNLDEPDLPVIADLADDQEISTEAPEGFSPDLPEPEDDGFSLDAPQLADDDVSVDAPQPAGDDPLPLDPARDESDEITLEEPEIDVQVLSLDADEEISLDTPIEADEEISLDAPSEADEAPAAGSDTSPAGLDEDSFEAIPENLRDEIKSVLSYLDQLLDALPEEKIEEFTRSEHFGIYKKLFDELGLKT